MSGRPIVVQGGPIGGWTWHCRECCRSDGAYALREDAINFGVYHLSLCCLSDEADRKASA